MATITVRIPDDINHSLSLIAESAERSKSYIVNKAIKHYIIRHCEEQRSCDAAIQK